MSPFSGGLHEFDLTGVSVMIGIPVNRDFPASTTVSLVETCIALRDHNIPVDLTLEVGCSIPQHARSLVADNFLRSDKTHLFWIDSDLAWKTEDFIKLLCLATQTEVVGATYPAKMEPTTFLMRFREDTQALNEFGCMTVDGLGLGFTVIQRKVMEQLAEKARKVKFTSRPYLVPYIFRCDTIEEDGQETTRGEDMAFFADIRALGYTIHVDPGVRLRHIGPKAYTGAMIDAMKRIS